MEETHGDYIEYVYETADEPVRGGLVAKAIYLKEVRAGNCGQAPHTVVVLEGSKQKRLKNNNARYGFLTSSNRLLEKLTVNFQGSTLRSYAFTYGEGAFNKDVLTGVKQLDDKGAEVSYQNFDYYDDVQAAKGYVPFKNSREKWDTHNDRLDAGFLNPITAVGGRFSDKPTALGGSLSSSIGGSFYAGVGLGDGSATTSNTAGASFSYSMINQADCPPLRTSMVMVPPTRCIRKMELSITDRNSVPLMVRLSMESPSEFVVSAISLSLVVTPTLEEPM